MAKKATSKKSKPWASPMPERQFNFMRDILAAPSPIGLEAAMSYGVLKPAFEKFMPKSWGIHQFRGNAGIVVDTHPGRDPGLLLGRGRALFGRGLRVHHVEVHKGKTVVFVVVGHEGERWVLRLDLRFENIPVPAHHLVEAAGSVDHVGKLGGFRHGHLRPRG